MESMTVTGILDVHTGSRDPSREKQITFSGGLTHCELVYYFTGEGVKQYGQKTLAFSPDTLEFLPPADPAVPYRVEPHSKMTYLVISFNCSYAVPRHAVSVKLGENNAVRAMVHKVQFLWQTRPCGWYYACLSLLYGILEQLEKIRSARYACSRAFLCLTPAEAYLQENALQSDLDYSRLCALCGISRTHFNRLFRQKYKASPVEHVTALRIGAACELLKTTAQPVACIAQRTGYDSVSYFSRIFKKQMGVSPAAYRAGF